MKINTLFTRLKDTPEFNYDNKVYCTHDVKPCYIPINL